jgi:hypothetical protein
MCRISAPTFITGAVTLPMKVTTPIQTSRVCGTISTILKKEKRDKFVAGATLLYV